jgi:hypothetical protein
MLDGEQSKRTHRVNTQMRLPTVPPALGRHFYCLAEIRRDFWLLLGHWHTRLFNSSGGGGAGSHTPEDLDRLMLAFYTI